MQKGLAVGRYSYDLEASNSKREEAATLPNKPHSSPFLNVNI